MKTPRTPLCAFTIALTVFAWSANSVVAALVFAEDFSSVPSATNPASQFTTSLDLYNSDSFAYTNTTYGNWTLDSGRTHAVDLDPNVTDNWAASFWPGPSLDAHIISSAAFNGNDFGESYDVTFLGGPGVYSGGNQVTTAGVIRFEIIRQSDSAILSVYDYSPIAWATAGVSVGNLPLAPDMFSYTGDGSGDVYLRLSSQGGTPGDFDGTIDQIRINSAAVPEPSSTALLGLGGLALMLRRRR